MSLKGTVGRRQSPGRSPGTMESMSSSNIVSSGFSSGRQAVNLTEGVDYIDFGNDSSLQITNNLSVSTWLECGSQTTYDNFITKTTTWNTDLSWAIRSDYEARKLAITLSDDGTFDAGHVKHWITNNTEIFASGWMHTVLTFASDVPEVYLNGTRITSWYKPQNAAFTKLYNSSASVKITAGGGWTGKRYNTSIWDTGVLTQADVTALYNSGNGINPKDLSPSGSARLVASWLYNYRNTYPTIKDIMVKGE